MKKISIAVLSCYLLLFGAIGFFAFCGGGCAHASQLDPSASYKSDAVLYNTDQAIAAAYTVTHDFVTWEFQNRAWISADISRAADRVRVNARKSLSSAIALREAYAAAPTTANRSALESAIVVLNAAMLEAMNYLPMPPEHAKQPFNPATP